MDHFWPFVFNFCYKMQDSCKTYWVNDFYFWPGKVEINWKLNQHRGFRFVIVFLGVLLGEDKPNGAKAHSSGKINLPSSQAALMLRAAVATDAPFASAFSFSLSFSLKSVWDDSCVVCRVECAVFSSGWPTRAKQCVFCEFCVFCVRLIFPARQESSV